MKAFFSAINPLGPIDSIVAIAVVVLPAKVLDWNGKEVVFKSPFAVPDMEITFE